MNYCTSCGASVPNDQTLCSMCYGDPAYGSDYYYRDNIENWTRADRNPQLNEEDYGDTQIIEFDDES